MIPKSFVPVCEDEGVIEKYVRPRTIGSIAGCFGKAKVELSAGRLLEFFRHRDRWCSFTTEELRNFYLAHKGWDVNQMFFGLMGGWLDKEPNSENSQWVAPIRIYLACNESGRWYVTDQFITACIANLVRKAA